MITTLLILLKGLILGITIAAPIGPIGFLCIERTLCKGRSSGFYTGLGAATVDSLYGALAAFGLKIITAFMTEHTILLKLIGSIFLIYLGMKAFINPIAIPTGETESKITASKDFIKDFLSSFFLTLTNPMTILMFTAVFAGAGITSYDNTYSAAVLVAGLFAGSLIWWLILSNLTYYMGSKLDDKTIKFISCSSGVLLIIMGAVTLGKTIS